MGEKFQLFEKTFLMSKKFVAFFLTLAVLAGIEIFLIWRITDAGNIGMWLATVMIVDIVCLSVVSVAFNLKQAALDSVVRLAAILGEKFPLDKFKNALK